MKKEELYNWVMRFNPYSQLYMAAERQNQNELWSGDKGNVIYAKTQSELELKIIKLDLAK